MENLKKNKAWIISGVVALVVILLIILLTVLAVTSTNPKQATEGMLTNLKAGEFEKAQEFVAGENELLSESAKELDTEIQKQLFNKLSWKFTNIVEEKDKEEATIEIEITNKDLKSIVRQIIKDAVANNQMSKDELEKALTEALKNENAQTISTTATIQAIKENKKWKIVDNEALENAIMPSLDEAIKAIKAIDAMDALNG